jgi:phosphomannomutase/phosphoglucomutase
METRINKNIFRLYDIRGIAYKDLTSDGVKIIGKAYGTYMKSMGYSSVTVGRDNRASSSDFFTNLSEGIMSTGCSVTNLGVVTTPLLYYSLFHLKTDGGVMITGSHNPPEYNGMKICVDQTSIFGAEIQKIRKICEENDFHRGIGKLKDADVITPYRKMLLQKFQFRKKIKVVMDAGNGTAGYVVPKLFEKLECDFVPLFCEPDSRFPNHHPDPTVPENLEALINKVKEVKADVGIAFDGDADRIGVVDEQGNILWGDKLLILYARDLLKRHPGASVIFEVKCSQTLSDDIEKNGGKPIMCAAGHSIIKGRMKKEKALLAGEMSGHMFFADEYFGYDDAIYAACRIIRILSDSNLSLSELLNDLPTTFSTPEIRVDCPDEKKFDVVKKVANDLKKDYKTIDIDGARVVFEHGWGLVRASNTQPVLVLRFEADSQEHLDFIQNTITSKLKEYL